VPQGFGTASMPWILSQPKLETAARRPMVAMVPKLRWRHGAFG